MQRVEQKSIDGTHCGWVVIKNNGILGARGAPEINSQLIKQYRKETENAEKRFKSFVWIYFQRHTGFVLCRICQCKLRYQPPKSTSSLVRHLQRVHDITRDNASRDSSTIPTKYSRAPRDNLVLQDRVYRNFMRTKEGLWRCKHCTFSVPKQEFCLMFDHLKATHRKASKIKFITPMPDKNCPLVKKSSKKPTMKPSTIPQETENNDSEDKTTCHATSDSRNILKAVAHHEPTSFDELDINHDLEKSPSSSSTDSARSPISSDTPSNVSAGAQTEESKGKKNLKVTITLPDGNQVEAFYVGSESYNPENYVPAVKTDDNSVGTNVQTLSTVTLEQPSSSSITQKAIDTKIREICESNISDSQVILEDDERPLSQRHPRKSSLTEERLTEVGETSMATESCQKEVKKEKLNFDEEDLQIVMENFPVSANDIQCNTNDNTFPNYQYIKTKRAGDTHNIAVIILDRPKVLNALCNKLMDELNDAVTKFDVDNSIGAIIITGSQRAFAAGSDIKEMQNHTHAEAIRGNMLLRWNGITQASKPLIAAVNGYALGSGSELAMMCDIIYAGENARFGHPEIIIGTIPRAGGTQRLTRAVGKSKAMEMLLTGNQISATEAEKSGLVSKVFPSEVLLSEAIKLGESISKHSQLIVSMAKEAVNSVFETNLQEGLRLERKLFCGTLATADRKEGMAAFIEKRRPQYKNE